MTLFEQQDMVALLDSQDIDNVIEECWEHIEGMVGVHEKLTQESKPQFAARLQKVIARRYRHGILDATGPGRLK